MDRVTQAVHLDALIGDVDFSALSARFCPFEAMGVVRAEIRHGNALAYCLNPVIGRHLANPRSISGAVIKVRNRADLTAAIEEMRLAVRARHRLLETGNAGR